LEEAAMNEEKNGFDVESSDITASRGLPPAVVVKKWRIAVALLAATVSFFLLTLVTFIATAWAGFQLFFVGRPEYNFLHVTGALLFYGFCGLVIFIYPIFIGSKRVFKKIINSGMKNV
jgi:hypothetical protein